MACIKPTLDSLAGLTYGNFFLGVYNIAIIISSIYAIIRKLPDQNDYKKE